MKWRSVFCLGLGFLLGAMPVASQELQSLQARFTQEKTTPLLNRPLLSSGILAYQPPHSLRWEYQQPVASVLLLHDGVTAKYLWREGQYVIDASASLGAMPVILQEISSWLGGRFSDNQLFTVARPDQRTVLLSPREDGLRAVISSIELKLAESDGLLDAVTIHESADTFTRLTFSKVAVNQPLPAAYFQKP